MADLWDDSAEAPPPVTLSPYERLRMQGVGPGLGATTGPAAPETILPMYASLLQPALRLPRITPPSTLGKVLAAPVNLAESALEGATSPVGALTLPLLGSSAGRMALGAMGTAGGIGQMAQAKDAGEFTQGALQTALSPMLFRRGPVAPSSIVEEAQAPRPSSTPQIPEAARQRFEAARQRLVIDRANQELGPEVVQRYQTQIAGRSNKAYAAGQAAHPNAENPYVEGSLEAKAFNLGKQSLSQTEGEVMRITRDGRRAMFDAKTKKFTRYAD